jgi:predicted hotdog family 3-hydroxylacyl-ACP dehydratase
MSRFGHAMIATMIPHTGTMCLLDEVLAWDAMTIRCLSQRFWQSDNPLRHSGGTLGMACSIELAAQAMAVHGRLIGADDTPATRGYLASLRDVSLAAARIDCISGDLFVDAELLMSDHRSAAYRFEVAAAGHVLASGRATVLLQVDG